MQSNPSANFLNRKSISRNTTHPQSGNLPAMLTGARLKGRLKQEQRQRGNSRLKCINRNTSSGQAKLENRPFSCVPSCATAQNHQTICAM